MTVPSSPIIGLTTPITDNTPDVISRFDRDLRHVFVNEAATYQRDGKVFTQGGPELPEASSLVRDGGKAGRGEHGPGRVRNLRPRPFQRFGGRRSLGPVGETGAGTLQCRHIGVKNCGAAIDRRVHKTELFVRLAPRNHRPCAGFQAFAGFVADFRHFEPVRRLT